jgi:hyaluronan synthase
LADTILNRNIDSTRKSHAVELPFLEEKRDSIFVVIIISVCVLVIFYAIKFSVLSLWIEFLQSTSFLRFITYPLLISAAVVFVGIAFRTLIWIRYKPMTVEKDEEILWPSVSIIMPALNEQELIKKSIDSIFASQYPQDKVEVICIDDGSTDFTLDKMNEAKKKYGKKIKIISYKRNLGKRKALYSGLKKSRGDIIVTVDTDSMIGRTAIRNVVIPLIKDERTGAVSGRVEVLNEKQNFLTRMLSIRYSISFNFGRAYQSVYGCVFCCPGALTAYRRNLMLMFIKDWVNQKFLNAPCTYGEDRSLTTQILRAGYMTRFQSNALVYTKVPSKFWRMNRMYIRWTRSYIRESIIFSQFMFTKYRPKSRVLPILDFFFLNFLHPFHLLALALVIYSFFINPLFILRQVAFLVILSFFLSLYYLRTKKSLNFMYGIPYALITAFCLWWIVPYAAATLKNQSWMTR